MNKTTRKTGPFPTPTHAAQHWYERCKAAEAERDALTDAIQAWTYDHSEDGPCHCSLCAALAAARPAGTEDARPPAPESSQ